MQDVIGLIDNLWLDPWGTPGYLGFSDAHGNRIWEQRKLWVHPNGFIQLDIDADNSRRLHFWGHPRIPRQKAYTTIHDHRYGFRSNVIFGRLMNTIYNVHMDLPERLCDYEVWSSPGKCKQSDLEFTGKHCRLDGYWSTIVNTGKSYIMQPWVFHESVPLQPTVTYMDKRAFTLPRDTIPGMNPRVLVRNGRPYDHEFMRRRWDTPGEQMMLWGIVTEILEENA